MPSSPRARFQGFLASAEEAEEGLTSGTDGLRAPPAERPKVEHRGAVGAEGGEGLGGGDDGDEHMPRVTVHVLTEENFERITRVATGATTGDWFVGKALLHM